MIAGAVVVCACLYFGNAAYNAVFASSYTPSDQDVSGWCSNGISGALDHLDAVHGDSAVEAAGAVVASMNLGECLAGVQRKERALNIKVTPAQP